MAAVADSDVHHQHHSPGSRHGSISKESVTSAAAAAGQLPVPQVHTPPNTDECSHKEDDDAASSSSLSDLGEDIDDMENRMRFEEAARAGAEAEQHSEITPDRYENGVPIFTPTMEQFKDFERYVKGVDPYGMQSGIVLIDPPEEWKRARKALDEMVKTIKIKNPITQEFHGAQGIYTQRNMEKMRSYNLPQWKSICEQTENQPPAKRGEKRLNADKLLGRGSTKNKKTEPLPLPEGVKRKAGRPRVKPIKEEMTEETNLLAPPTPTSPHVKPATPVKNEGNNGEGMSDITPIKKKPGRKPGPKPKGSQPTLSNKKEAGKGAETTVAARRLRNAREAADEIDEEAFQDFDYRVHDNDQWTAERCDELEEKYWKSLNFSNPMYAADMPGSLFDEKTKEWNVAKLPNLLDLLGQPIPGVNTAYLYLGMWRATFAWHLEDVDLYSINYIHFGAPKQWYSISQKDAPKFEAAMKSIWSSDAKSCDQFLRHKTYLVSPALLKSKFGVQVNKVVHREGQFVITFPIGYHSGYNLGYNCAESVNFAIENWLQYGKTARKCQCEADSVFIDVDWFVRRMNGEPTPEYEEVEVTDDEDDMDEPTDLPTPPGSDRIKIKIPAKRKRTPKDVGPNKKAKKIVKIRKVSKIQPCCLCPNDFAWEELLPTSHGQRAHRTCAMYTPETYIATKDGNELVFNVENISKARLELKCYECRQKKGSCFQCSSAKCTRSYHATCAMQAGVQVDKGEISVWHEGVEYRDIGFDWRCRLHRTVKRSRITSELSACNHANTCWQSEEFLVFLQNLKPGELIQWQASHADDIEAGVVDSAYDLAQNTILVKVLPEQRIVREIDPASILFVDSATSCLQKPSSEALDLPEDLQGKTASLPESTERKPSEGDPFTENPKTEWAEFVSHAPAPNKAQQPVDLFKDKQVWLYIGATSTDSKAHYTSDPNKPVHDPASNFLGTVEPPRVAMAPPSVPRRQSLAASHPLINIAARNATMVSMRQHIQTHDTIPRLTPEHMSVMNAAREVSTQREQSPQVNPPNFHDVVASIEGKVNEPVVIQQKQASKPQNQDKNERKLSASLPGIGIDKEAMERQKQFQIQASQQSRNMDQPRPSLPPLSQFQQDITNFTNSSPSQSFATPASLNFSHSPSPIPQLRYGQEWANPAPMPHPRDINQGHDGTSDPMAFSSSHFSYGGSMNMTSTARNFAPSHHSPLQFQHFSPIQPAPRPNLDSMGHMTQFPLLDGFRPIAMQPMMTTTAEIERRRRISNPSYPFKSPDQIKAQKEADKMSPPTSRPNSSYKLPSPRIKQEPSIYAHSTLHAIQHVDPRNPPQFINPNATQLSPPGSSAGQRSASGSVSGLTMHPLMPGPLPPPPINRPMSTGLIFDTLSFATPPTPVSDYLPKKSMYDPSFAASITFTSLEPMQPDPPVAEPSSQLVASLRARSIGQNGLITNDQVLPQILTDWRGKGGFWGRVAVYYVQKHSAAASVYRSPFAALARTAHDRLSLADRYYEILTDDEKAKVDSSRTRSVP